LVKGLVCVEVVIKDEVEVGIGRCLSGIHGGSVRVQVGVSRCLFGFLGEGDRGGEESSKAQSSKAASKKGLRGAGCGGDRGACARPPLGACPRRYCWWWRWITPNWEATVDEGCNYRPEKHPRSQDPTWTNREAPCCRRDPTSGVDRYESRDFYFEFDKIDLHQFDQPPPGAGEREA
jgi:hypothetical protein